MGLAVRQKWMEGVDIYEDYNNFYRSYCNSISVLYNTKYKQACNKERSEQSDALNAVVQQLAAANQQVEDLRAASHQDAEYETDALTALDAALTMFIPEDIRNRVFPINGQFSSNPISLEEGLDNAITLFARAYTYFESLEIPGLQAFCLNSFENLRAAISSSEIVSEEGKNKLKDLSNNLAEERGMPLKNKWL